jgi:hypothetical protein
MAGWSAGGAAARAHAALGKLAELVTADVPAAVRAAQAVRADLARFVPDSLLAAVKAEAEEAGWPGL